MGTKLSGFNTVGNLEWNIFCRENKFVFVKLCVMQQFCFNVTISNVSVLNIAQFHNGYFPGFTVLQGNLWQLLELLEALCPS